MLEKKEKRNKIRLVITWVIVFLAIEVLVVVQVGNWYNLRTYEYKQKHVAQLEIQYQTVLNTFGASAKLIFSEKINTPKITSLLSQAKNANTAERQQIRDSLHKSLISTYENMKAINFRQLHFHLPNNESFLRFHCPEKFGDNLTGIRKTVMVANSEKHFVFGFEEGRIYNGFRYVFPLSHNGEHVGSVETSISFKAIRDLFSTHEDARFAFILKKKIVKSKVFLDEQSNYIECSFNNNYFFDKQIWQNELVQAGLGCNKKFADLFSASDKENLLQKMANGERFVYAIRCNKEHVLFSFCPVLNFDNKHVGYFLSYKENAAVHKIRQNYYFLIIVLSLLIFIICFAFVYMSTTKQIIKGQTKNLQELNNTKDRFFSIIAHDLKTPFNAIIGFGDLLEEAINSELWEPSKEYVQLLNSASSNAFFLLENLLQWSRQQSGRVQVTPTELALCDVVNEVVVLNYLRAQEKQVKITNEVDQASSVLADYNTLSTILRNLISNAIKFTPEGGNIKISAKTQEDTVQVRVRDTGIGIAPENVQKLFQSESLFSTNGTHDEKGTGLGLVLCKEFVELNGGKIDVESEIGKGTSFIFTLPKPPEVMFATHLET